MPLLTYEFICYSMNSYNSWNIWIHISSLCYEFICLCYEFIYPLSIIWIHIIRQLYEFILFVHTSYQFVYSSQSQLHRQFYKWNRFFLKIALWPPSTFYCASLLTRILGLLILWLVTLSWKCCPQVVTCRHDMTCRSNFGQMGPVSPTQHWRCRGSLCQLELTFTRFSEVRM